MVNWLADIAGSKPASPLRPLFLLNLAYLIVIGTAACGWALYYTDWFPEVGGLLALGGLFSWMAFVFRLVPDDTAKALREGFAAMLNRPVILIAILFLSILLWHLSSGYGAVRIEAHQNTIPREAWIYADNPQEPVTLSADGTSNVLVRLSGPTTRHVKIKGRPMLLLPLLPQHRSPLSYPDSFQRHVVLVTPTAALVRYWVGDHSSVRLEVTVSDPNKGLYALDIADYTWFPFWIGCSDDVATNDVARLQLTAVAKDLEEPLASIFLFPPRSEPKWYCPTCSAWSVTERELPDGGSLKIRMSVGTGKKRRILGSQTIRLQGGGPDFIEVAHMRETFFK